MNIHDFNLFQIEQVASALGSLLDQVTFVGGATTTLFVDEAARYGARRTEDVDVIVDIATIIEYHQFGEQLKELGFREDEEGPMCRWILEGDIAPIKIDVMPVSESALGFSNRWYQEAIENSYELTLQGGSVINVITATYFIATKFEAFEGRGNGDYFSHDLEDIVFVLENRNRIIFELQGSSDELKKYFAIQAAQLLNMKFLNILPGLLNDSGSVRAIENGLKIMSKW